MEAYALHICHYMKAWRLFLLVLINVNSSTCPILEKENTESLFDYYFIYLAAYVPTDTHLDKALQRLRYVKMCLLWIADIVSTFICIAIPSEYISLEL